MNGAGKLCVQGDHPDVKRVAEKVLSAIDRSAPSPFCEVDPLTALLGLRTAMLIVAQLAIECGADAAAPDAAPVAASSLAEVNRQTVLRILDELRAKIETIQPQQALSPSRIILPN